MSTDDQDNDTVVQERLKARLLSEHQERRLNEHDLPELGPLSSAGNALFAPRDVMRYLIVLTVLLVCVFGLAMLLQFLLKNEKEELSLMDSLEPHVLHGFLAQLAAFPVLSRSITSPGFNATRDLVVTQLSKYHKVMDVQVQYFPVDVSVAGPEGATRLESVWTSNVIADVRGGSEEDTIVIFAHMDSSDQGPGLNDNGSGVAAALAIASNVAEFMEARNFTLRNHIRFCFFGAGLKAQAGSKFYLDSLGPDRPDHIALAINLDMIGSMNYIFATLNASTIPQAGYAESLVRPSEVVGQVLAEMFHRQLEPLQSTVVPVMSHPSDHLAFLENDIPTNAVYAGSSEIKTGTQRDLYGGSALAPLDACNDTPLDSIGNVNTAVMLVCARAVAGALELLAAEPDLDHFLQQPYEP